MPLSASDMDDYLRRRATNAFDSTPRQTALPNVDIMSAISDLSAATMENQATYNAALSTPAVVDLRDMYLSAADYFERHPPLYTHTTRGCKILIMPPDLGGGHEAYLVVSPSARAGMLQRLLQAGVSFPGFGFDGAKQCLTTYIRTDEEVRRLREWAAYFGSFGNATPPTPPAGVEYHVSRCGDRPDDLCPRSLMCAGDVR